MSKGWNWLKKLTLIWRDPERVKKGIDNRTRQARKMMLMQLTNVVHVGNRASCREVQHDGMPHIKKEFADNEMAKSCMTREVAAREIFAERPWMVPIADAGESHITLPKLPEDRMLSQLATQLSENEKLEIAKQSIQIAFEIFLEGYAHRDFHSKNMFWIDGQLRVVDYEMLHPYPAESRPAFPLSYDLIGEGLESPFATGNMCYESSIHDSLGNILGVPLEVAIEGLQDSISEMLRTASLTFEKLGTRHICKTKKIYNSIDLPHFKVAPAEAQRNCSMRFKTLGIEQSDIEGKRLLDLGSNIGGMIFEAQRRKPAESIGVEYDSEKVEVSRMMAAYNGLNNVSFLQADIDTLEASSLGEFGVVFCFAIEAHVKKKQRLFELLAQVTSEKLFFEGNSGTNAEAAKAKLLEVGFKDVKMLGMCDDDYLDANNVRPLLVATK